MRYHSFVALTVVALILDIVLLSAGLWPAAQPHPSAPGATSEADVPTTRPPSATPTLTPSPSATPTPSPSATPTPTASPTLTPSPVPPTATPLPQLVRQHNVKFTPSDRAVRANIRLALDHYYGALTHIALPPGGVFSFNATLGVYPPALPWKSVVVRSTAVPVPAATPESPDAPPAPAPAAAPDIVQRIQGGGLCDLASRYVMAARPLLPARAFRYVNHVRSNGIHLYGVPDRDAVSIWAIGGGQAEHDLTITNVTGYWLEFTVERAGEQITVYARLWDGIPPDW